ncbi:MAG: SDR family NAD(P)-dependent oxidoreductase, partial [Polyangiaceae bacterium]
MDDALDFPAGAAWVIGGSGGVGAAICEALAKRGCPVALTYHRNRAAADEVCERLRAFNVIAHAGQLDLADTAAIAQEFQGVRERFGRVHSV